MKKISISLIALLLLSFSTGLVSAETIGERNKKAEEQQVLQQQKDNEAQQANDQKNSEMRQKDNGDQHQWGMTRDVLKKTADLIISANKSDRRHKSNRDLMNAIYHQKYAKKLYLAKDFDNAIYQSLYARQFALSILKSNRVKIRKDDERVAAERDWEKSRKSSPSYEELDKQMDRDMPKEDRHDNDIRQNSNWTIDISISD